MKVLKAVVKGHTILFVILPTMIYFSSSAIVQSIAVEIVRPFCRAEAEVSKLLSDLIVH